MQRSIIHPLTCRLASLGIILLAVIAGSTPATAQIFQYTYGGTDTDFGWCVEQDPLRNEYIVVGISNSFMVPDQDIYIAKIDNCGALIWARTYDIGGNDHGTRIRRTNDDGYIITGTTRNTRNYCTRDDIFLMKINQTGMVTWVKTYGGAFPEVGTDVLVVDNGYIVAGHTLSFHQGTMPMADGFLMKTRPDGSVEWARSYGGTYSDFLNSCCIAPNGDILAVGSTASFSPNGKDDVYLIRVSQTNGLPVAGFPVYYPDTSKREVGHAIVLDANGDAAIAGFTDDAAGNSEGLLMKVNANNGARICDITYGGANGGGQDVFFDLKAVATGFIVTGLMTNVPGGFGNRDAYVGHVGSCFNGITHTVHGDSADDDGRSIISIPGGMAPQSVTLGSTNSFGLGNYDLYLISQQGNGNSGCHDGTPNLVTATPNLHPSPASTCSFSFAIWCDAVAITTPRQGAHKECSSCPVPPNAPQGGDDLLFGEAGR